MSRELAQAIRQDEDIQPVITRGVVSARRISGMLRAKAVQELKTGHQFPVREFIVKELLAVTRDTMLVTHLLGIKRSMLNRPKKAGLELGVFDSVLKVLKKQTGANIEKLQQQYNTQALKVLNTAGKEVEDHLRSTIQGILETGVSNRQAIRTLGEKFDQLGITPKNPFQLETIFRTQTQLAYGAGRWEADQDPDIQEILWGYKYVTVGDDRVRPEHKALDGTTLPKDDIFWKTFFPPNGWNCRCQAISIFEERKEVKPGTIDGAPVKPDKDFNFNPGQVFST